MTKKDEFLLQIIDKVSVASENFTNNIEDFVTREKVVNKMLGKQL